MDLPQGFVSALTAAVLLSFDWGIVITFPWKDPAKFNQTYHFRMSVHSFWELAGPPKGIYLPDEVGHKPKCCGPLNLTMKTWSLSHPNFHPVKNLESHTTVSHPEVLEKNLEELKMQNKQSFIWEQLTRDPGDCWRGRKQRGLCGYLHLLLGVIFRILSSWLQVLSHRQDCQMTTKQSSKKFDILHSRENKAWIGELQHLTSSEPLFPLSWLLQNYSML